MTAGNTDSEPRHPEGTRNNALDRDAAARQMVAAHRVIKQWWASHFLPGRTHMNLTWTQFMILDLATEEPTINMAEIARRLDVTPPTIVRSVGFLERKGLARRSRPSAKRRDVTVELTREGREAHRLVADYRHARVVQLLSAMSDEKTCALIAGYTDLARVAADDPA